MKIADVRAYPLRTRTALVRVFTDGGVEGIGECSPMSVPVMCHFVQTVLRPLVLGKDPLDVERLWDAMYFGTYKLGTEGTQPSAISGVDIAMWTSRPRSPACLSTACSGAPSARRSRCTSRSAAGAR
jgi:L-alanine-DL-glutamate epimerase-like enolase superfamily enzyme